MLSSIYDRSTPAWSRFVAKLWRAQVPDGFTSQWSTSWHIFITRSWMFEFSSLTLLRILSSVVSPLRICGNTCAFNVGGAAMSSSIR